MNNKQLLFRNFMLIVALFLTGFANAQMTIGSANATNEGSLLDIKEYDDAAAKSGGRNAIRGLGMPRIRLNNLNNLNDLGLPGTANDAHIGLVIYNVNQCMDYALTDTRGLYVWEGTKWQKLSDKGRAPFVYEHTDMRDPANPEKYLYRKFGDAGIWMLENMRAKTYQQGGTPPVIGIPTSPEPPYEKRFAYPAPSGNGTNSTYFDKVPAIGLLYSYAAVTNNENTAMLTKPVQDQVAGSTPGPDELENAMPGGKIQGICPNGWHVPSDREWNKLEKELSDFPERYSTNSGTSWNPAWETSSDDRGNHGVTMKTPCMPPNMGGNAVGKSFSASDGGFNFFLAGFGYAFNGQLSNYGMWGYVRTSSSSADSAFKLGYVRSSWHRSLGSGNEYISRIDSFQSNLMTVRCKKDNDTP